MKVSQAVSKDLVGQVAFDVDGEAVLAERLFCWPRLEFVEVEIACGELPEDHVQAARTVRGLETHDARFVMAGRCGDAPLRSGDNDEAGRIAVMVLDTRGEDLQAVKVGSVL